MIGASYAGKYLVADVPEGKNSKACVTALTAAIEKGALEKLE